MSEVDFNEWWRSHRAQLDSYLDAISSALLRNTDIVERALADARRHIANMPTPALELSQALYAAMLDNADVYIEYVGEHRTSYRGNKNGRMRLEDTNGTYRAQLVNGDEVDREKWPSQPYRVALNKSLAKRLVKMAGWNLETPIELGSGVLGLDEAVRHWSVGAYMSKAGDMRICWNQGCFWLEEVSDG